MVFGWVKKIAGTSSDKTTDKVKKVRKEKVITANSVDDNAVADNSVADNSVADNAVDDNAVDDSAVADNSVDDNAKQKTPSSKTSEKSEIHIDIAVNNTENAIVKSEPAKTKADTKKNWLNRMVGGLEKSSSKISDSISGVFTKRKLDAKAIDALQDILIMSDMGVATAQTFTDNISSTRFDKEVSDEEIKEAIVEEIEKVLSPLCKPLEINEKNSPHIILMVGVNGAGKTTTIGKLASKYIADGKKVMLGAGDTFRAAAVEQLQVWGKRVGADVISKPEGTDAGALVYEAIERAKAEKADVLLIDTAGRLHNKDYLMEALKKIDRVIKKLVPDAPHDTVLILDGTVGQNALEQVKHFSDCVPITGIIMTKLDGSAKGGTLVNIASQFSVNIHAVGVGETADDLNAFMAKDFAMGIMGVSPKEDA